MASRCSFHDLTKVPVMLLSVDVKVLIFNGLVYFEGSVIKAAVDCLCLYVLVCVCVLVCLCVCYLGLVNVAVVIVSFMK